MSHERRKGAWWLVLGALVVELGLDCFGLAAVVACGVPASAFFLGDWVAAGVVHDVEGGVALHDV